MRSLIYEKVEIPSLIQGVCFASLALRDMKDWYWNAYEEVGGGSDGMGAVK